MLECMDLSYRYPSGTSVAVGPINLQIQKGQLTLLSGPTGCVKSTLLRLMAGSLQRHGQGECSGEVRLDGDNPVDWAPSIRAHRLGFVTQCPGDQIVSGTVWDELTFGMDSAGLFSKNI